MKRIILIGIIVVLFLITGIAGIVLLLSLIIGFAEGYINPLGIVVLLLVEGAGITGLIFLRKRVWSFLGI